MNKSNIEVAGYSKTTPAENASVFTFNSLVNTHFVVPYTTTSDKTPNIDGYVVMTDKEQKPIGKLELQIKTLTKRNLKSPKYQCKKSFLAYCKRSQLPVLLITVDSKNRKAYWLHMDSSVVSDALNRINKKSVSIKVPLYNCIDGIQENYINSWIDLVEKAIANQWNFDSVFEQKEKIEIEIKKLQSKLQSPTKLPLQALKSIHNYLDKYNYILDIEFSSVKEILYPNYWKIGIGVIKYEFADIRYILFPVEYKKEQTLIKEIIFDANTDISLEMMNGNILVFVSSKSIDDLKDYPVQTAYKSLEDSILKIAGKFKFPISDDFIAHEYIVSFIDRNCVYLDMEAGQDSYSMQDLKYKLFKVLPMHAATEELGFADWVTECNHSIDSYSSWKTSTHFKKKVTDAVKKVKEGFVPKVKVTITSEIYNIDLITYYIDYLQSKGCASANRKFKQGQFDEVKYRNAIPFKQTWNKDILWENTQLFFRQYYKLYDKYIGTHFHHIQHLLQIIPAEAGTILCLFIGDVTKGGPYLEIYYLRPDKPGENELYFFADTNPDNPIDRKKIGLENKCECIVNGKAYEIIQMHVQTLDFMFEISPIYTLINKKLGEKLKEFFREKQRKVKLG